MSHPPSPWTIDGSFDAGVEVGILDAEGIEILGIVPTDGPDLDEWGERSIGLARLIAAAPELLEALKSIENDAEHIPPSIWALRCSAIAKAEGPA